MLKAKFDTERISVRLGMAFARFGISPNTWTVMAIFPAILGFIVLFFYGNIPESLPLALVLFLLSGLLDAIDGAVARVTSRVSALGAFLDGIIDRYVEILMYVGLLFYLLARNVEFFLPSGFWITFLVFGSLMPTYIRAYADHRKVVTDQDDLRRMGGLLERAERLTLVYLAMLLGSFDLAWLIYILAATAVLANYTALQRLWSVISYARRQ